MWHNSLVYFKICIESSHFKMIHSVMIHIVSNHLMLNEFIQIWLILIHINPIYFSFTICVYWFRIRFQKQFTFSKTWVMIQYWFSDSHFVDSFYWIILYIIINLSRFTVHRLALYQFTSWLFRLCVFTVINIMIKY